MPPAVLKLLLAPFLLIPLCAQLYAQERTTIWIDVRTPAEFSAIHVEGAINIEFQHIKDHIASVTTDKDADIQLYCKSGRRSSVAKQSLAELGYTSAKNAGGIAAALATYERQQTNSKTK